MEDEEGGEIRWGCNGWRRRSHVSVPTATCASHTTFPTFLIWPKAMEKKTSGLLIL